MDNDWWRGAVCQIYPRSFQDHNGDGVGVSLAERLDCVADLGVDNIWLSPFSPHRCATSADVSNYRERRSHFGTLGDFDRLLEKAHGLGLKVIIDQVISHSPTSIPGSRKAG